MAVLHRIDLSWHHIPITHGKFLLYTIILHRILYEDQLRARETSWQVQLVKLKWSATPVILILWGIVQICLCINKCTWKLCSPANLDAKISSDGSWVRILGIGSSQHESACFHNIQAFPNLKQFQKILYFYFHPKLI